MHALAKTRCHQMAKSMGTTLTEPHLRVLEYAWEYYRERRVGPLYTNIRRNTGVGRPDIESMFPNGLISIYTWVGIPIQTTESGCKPVAIIEVENPREVYFDNNATTPIRSEVSDALISFFQDPRSFGNPSSSYAVGGVAYDIIYRARKRIAAGLKVAPGEIYFTGSGTESNNMAIKSVAAAQGGGHMISTNVEHPSVLETLRYLETTGFDVTFLPVARDGTLSAGAVEQAFRDDTILVTIMAANNEIGTIYPIAEIGAVCRARNVPFHVDAIQAFGKYPIAPKEAGIDMLSLSGHKIYAPKGVGVIFVDKDQAFTPLIHGGGQENGLRAGTENVAGILAVGLAAELACAEIDEARAHYDSLRHHFLDKLEQLVPDAVVNGTMEPRLPHNLSVGFAGVDSGSLLLSFDQIGVYVSAGSACSAGDDKISHVLEAIGADSERYGTIRFSFGRESTIADIDYLFEHLPTILEQLRKIETDSRQIA